MKEINQKGPAEIISTCGGIYLVIMPVTIENKNYYIVYDSESYYYDDKNLVEFTVYNEDLNEMEKRFFDNGLYIESMKKSPYKNLFKQLKKALKKELKNYSYIRR